MSRLKYISPSDEFRKITYELSEYLFSAGNECSKIANNRIAVSLNNQINIERFFDIKQKVKFTIII